MMKRGNRRCACIGWNKHVAKVTHVSTYIGGLKTEYLSASFSNRMVIATSRSNACTGIQNQRMLARRRSKNHVRITKEDSASWDVKTAYSGTVMNLSRKRYARTTYLAFVLMDLIVRRFMWKVCCRHKICHSRLWLISRVKRIGSTVKFISLKRCMVGSIISGDKMIRK